MGLRRLQTYICFCTVFLVARGRILRLQCKSFANFAHKEDGKRLQGALIKSYNDKPVEDCQVACLFEPQCKSFNVKDSQCELNNRTTTDFTDNCTKSSISSSTQPQNNCTLVPKGNWSFISTNYESREIGENCQNVKPCKIDQLCIDSCQCPGYECRNCGDVSSFKCPEKDECQSNPCQNGGQCTDMKDAFKCKCMAGYTGLRCETNINDCSSNPCQSGGQCIDGINNYFCSCNSGFTGTNCETVVKITCAAAYCQNGGTCADTYIGFKCNCVTGYTGLYCATNI